MKERFIIFGAQHEGSSSSLTSGKPAFSLSFFARLSAARALHSVLLTSKSDDSSVEPGQGDWDNVASFWVKWFMQILLLKITMKN